MRCGVLGEFMTPEAMIAAIVGLRDRGYRRLDAFSPYPVHGAEEAAGTPRSPLGWIAFQVGLVGAGATYLLQWYCNAYDYPLDVGGRPPHSAPAFIPITFEMGVLSAALAADPAARAAFDTLSFSNQRRHVLAIDGAKTDATRQRRLDAVLAELAGD